MRTLPRTDVVIVGLGAAGGIAAKVLTRAGLQVVALEAGPYLDNAYFLKGMDEIAGFAIRNRMGDVKFNREMPTWRPNEAAPAKPPPIAFRMMNAVGGTSIHYGAQSWRFSPNDFRIRSTTIERYGKSALPENSALADWPLTYDDLEPFYDQVERAIGVCGSGGKNPFEGRRTRDYPMPPLRLSGYSRLAQGAMASLGYHPFQQPAAINSMAYGGRPSCTFCGFCSGFGCWNNSKSSTLVTAIHEAEMTGRLDVRPMSTVTRISSNKHGRASGVQYRTTSGELIEQPAGLVILSSFVYENVRRLLLSRSRDFPNGLANNGGLVGKYYMTHMLTIAAGLFPGVDLGVFNGTQAQAMAMDDLNGDNFDHSRLGFLRGGLIYAGSESRPISTAQSRPPDIPAWGPGYKAWVRDNSRSIGSLVAQVETLPYESNCLELDPQARDAHGEPVVRVTYDHQRNEQVAGRFFVQKLTQILKKMGAAKTWPLLPPIPIPVHAHAYGGTRMGEDPSRSVVNKFSLSHEVPNLAILGSSTFPSTSGYNPTQTIQALAWLAADHMAANFQHIAAA